MGPGKSAETRATKEVRRADVADRLLVAHGDDRAGEWARACGREEEALGKRKGGGTTCSIRASGCHRRSHLHAAVCRARWASAPLGAVGAAWPHAVRVWGGARAAGRRGGTTREHEWTVGRSCARDRPGGERRRYRGLQGGAVERGKEKKK